jgi:hypothetical protein
MNEIIANLHMHTRYSDGTGTHAQIAQAAMRAGIDVVMVTDHNVLVSGPEETYREDKRAVLLLIGEEIHNQARLPQANHLLVFGAGKELAHLAYDQDLLLDAVRKAGGLAFAAHPVDPEAPAVNEPSIGWDNLDVPGLTGLELWNGFSEFKGRLYSKAHAVYYAYQPSRIARGPFPETLARWDELLSRGRRFPAIGSSDAHALQARLGPFRRPLFPYELHFRSVNTHLLLPTPLTGEITEDRRMVLEALGRGRGFIGYDLPAPTRGFKFTAQGMDQSAQMGDDISCRKGVTLQIRLPRPVECRLIQDGKVVKTWSKRETCTYITTEPGAFRVEATIPFHGQARGWIYSNPIYVTR